ncbi:MAG TPA: dihydrofolate reductase [bacterium]|nr:dihydrofolate reductase [bacterium]HOR57101.1 dihydrofolate reductase [bacterium]HPL56116.1 dihydrofolate reductase [bacterium]
MNVKNKPLICIIAAVARNGVIGSRNTLPWHIPQDFLHFKRLTMGYPLIMGENTHSSIGGVLPGRTNIVLTHKKNFSKKGIKVAHSTDEALQIAGKENRDKVFIIGGGYVYRQFIAIADRLYLTELNKDYNGEITFPSIVDFQPVKELGGGKCGDIEYKFKMYERKNAKR